MWGSVKLVVVADTRMQIFLVFFFQEMHFSSFSVLTLIHPSLSASFSFFYFYKFFDGSPLWDFSVSSFVFFLSTSVNKPDWETCPEKLLWPLCMFSVGAYPMHKELRMCYFCKLALSLSVEVQALKLYWMLSYIHKSEDSNLRGLSSEYYSAGNLNLCSLPVYCTLV